MVPNAESGTVRAAALVATTAAALLLWYAQRRRAKKIAPMYTALDEQTQKNIARHHWLPLRAGDGASQPMVETIYSLGETHDWAVPMRKALISLPDAEPGQPRFMEKYASDNAPVLHGATTYFPNGLTRSMEAEFRDNDREEGAPQGKWWPNYYYVVHERAVEEAVQVFVLAPVHTRDGPSRILRRRRRRAGRISARPRSPPCDYTLRIGLQR
jgi:hypothetical protein